MVKKYIPGQLGLFVPESDWVAPTELPDLRNRKIVAIDAETRDDGLGSNKGPGWAIGPRGYVAGVSWAAEGTANYASIAHPDSENFQPENVMRWLDDLFKTDVPIVFHNAPYDIGWTGVSGVRKPKKILDTSAAAVMLDEQQRSYSLDNCCKRAGIKGKDESLLREAVRAYGGNPDRPQADLWRLPAQFVGPYATQDTVATLQLWEHYAPQISAQGMDHAFDVEMRLIPVVHDMRKRGIRIDVDRAETMAAELRLNVDRICTYISSRLSVRRKITIEDLRSPQWLATHFSAEEIRFPRTPGGKQGSFSAEWMSKSEHWLPKLVVEARKFEDSASKFVENFILGYLHRGRLHAEVHQFLTDEGGTRSQRFSYSNPALQQMPRVAEGKDDKPIPAGENPWEYYGGIGGAIRGLFLPEKGQAWGAFDYSQQEPRITVHFAAVLGKRGADVAVQKYLDNPRTDYHRMVAEMTGMPRNRAKILNLAMVYGKGKHSTALELGLPLHEAEELINQFHERLPFVKPLEEEAKNRAASRGFIKLIDGARMHYNEWEGRFIPSDERNDAIRAGYRLDPCSREEAEERCRDKNHPWAKGRLRRADTRKALNNLVQGSAARQTKRAIVNLFEAEGIIPLIQMHDEIGCSVGSEREAIVIHDHMRDAIPLRVPVVVDAELGTCWGDAKHSWAEYVEKNGAPRAN